MSKLWESPPQNDKYDVTVARWFIECVPHLHPMWNHYLVVCVALKDVDGLPAAKKHFPTATHELMVLALDRDKKPTYDDDESHHILTPPNYYFQFTATDEQAKNITYQAALLFNRGEMLLETSGIYGARKLNDTQMERLVRKETV